MLGLVLACLGAWANIVMHVCMPGFGVIVRYLHASVRTMRVWACAACVRACANLHTYISVFTFLRVYERARGVHVLVDACLCVHAFMHVRAHALIIAWTLATFFSHNGRQKEE